MAAARQRCFLVFILNKIKPTYLLGGNSLVARLEKLFKTGFGKTPIAASANANGLEFAFFFPISKGVCVYA